MERCGDYGGKRRQSGKPCMKPAGWGVKDTTTGKCRIHGGANKGRPIIHGRYSLKHRQSLQAKMQKFLEDPEPGNLYSELALIRTLLQDFLDRFPEGVPLAVRDMKIVVDMNEAIGKTVERISRILNQTALTQADIVYLRAILVDLIIRYIDEPDKRAAFFTELETTLGASGRSEGSVREQINSPIG